jgi:hypothetical protein
MDAVYLGIAVGITTIIFVILNRSKKRLGITDSEINVPRLQIGGGSRVHKFSRSIGLDSSHSKMLSFVLKNGENTKPEQIIQSPDLLDLHFKRAYNTIEQTAGAKDETQRKISLLFATRNILESATGGGAGVYSTRTIPENTPAVLLVNENSYPVRVVSSRGAYLLVENPVNAVGDLISIDRNEPVTLSFFTKSSNGFSVNSTVYGTTKAPGAGRVLQIVHSNAIKRLSQRRFRRREIVIPAEFSTVRLEQGPRKREQKMVVDKQKTPGRISDISVGGCSIQTSHNVSAGVRLKIEFNASGQHVVALGEVLRVNRNRAGAVAHVKFLKIPRKSLNLINALVFDYIDT